MDFIRIDIKKSKGEIETHLHPSVKYDSQRECFHEIRVYLAVVCKEIRYRISLKSNTDQSMSYNDREIDSSQVGLAFTT